MKLRDEGKHTDSWRGLYCSRLWRTKKLLCRRLRRLGLLQGTPSLISLRFYVKRIMRVEALGGENEDDGVFFLVRIRWSQFGPVRAKRHYAVVYNASTIIRHLVLIKIIQLHMSSSKYKIMVLIFFGKVAFSISKPNIIRL